eukprot:m.12502 g.12502  ORF g.12502 m.12502 type:complete len:253 (+) comp9334_c0_seq1:150-908(+)
MSQAKIAVLYGTKGGLGDVGKFAVIHAVRLLQPKNVKIVALSAESTEGDDLGFEIDVYPDRDTVHKQFREIMLKHKANVVKIDIEGEDAESKIAAALEGTDAVVACLGNRQPKMARWLGTGSQKTIGAMQSQDIKRLVILSSMGIGEDFMPFGFIRVLWSILLRTFFRPAFRDLHSLEENVINADTSLDYTIVRPVQIDPHTPASGSWNLLQSWTDKPVGLAVSKSDVALFMVEQAIAPTLHRTAVTIGSSI